MTYTTPLRGATICINCGMPAGTIDISGCTRDTETAHDYRPLDDRPFRSWTFEAIVARMERASMKGASAAATADHFARCPMAGAGTMVHRLYVQKAQKRLTLAQALSDELWARAHGQNLPPLEMAGDREHYDDELTFDEVEGIGLDGTGRDGDPRFPYRYSNLTRAEMKRLDHFRRARPFRF